MQNQAKEFAKQKKDLEQQILFKEKLLETQEKEAWENEQLLVSFIHD